MTRRRRTREALPAPDLAADREARLAAIVAEVDPPPPPPAIVPDMGQLVRAEVARQQAADQQAAAAAERARYAHPDGTGCAHCGLSHCATYDPGEPGSERPGWYRRRVGDHHGAAVCAACTAELYGWVGEDSDDRRRVRAALVLLGLVGPDGGGRWPAVAINDPAQLAPAMPWFIETDASPSLTRWAWLDVDQLRTRWDAALNPPVGAAAPQLVHGAPCNVCGVADRWQPYDAPNGAGGVIELRRCVGCNMNPTSPDLGPADADTIVSGLLVELTGRQHVGGIAQALGLGLFDTNGPGRPQARPFAWWGDVPAKARRVWPARADFDRWYHEHHAMLGTATTSAGQSDGYRGQLLDGAPR